MNNLRPYCRWQRRHRWTKGRGRHAIMVGFFLTELLMACLLIAFIAVLAFLAGDVYGGARASHISWGDWRWVFHW